MRHFSAISVAIAFPALLSARPAAAADPSPPDPAPALPPPAPAPAPAPATLPAPAPSPAPSLAPSLAPAPAPTPSPSLPPPASPPDEPDVDDGLLGTHQRHWFASIAYRGALIRSDGFDPFSREDALHQASVALGDAFYAAGRLSVAAALTWDYGERSADVRRADTKLQVHRITLAPELRYHVLRRLYAFGRVGAGVAVLDAAWSDPIVKNDRQAQHVAFTVDPSLGVAAELVGESAGLSQRPRLWLLADAGYLFTTEMALTMKSPSGAPARTDAMSLGSLSLSGVTFRVGAAVSY